MSSDRRLHPWQVSTGGIAGLILSIGLARFAYTPLIPSLIQAHWFSAADTVTLGGAAERLSASMPFAPFAPARTAMTLILSLIVVPSVSVPVTMTPLVPFRATAKFASVIVTLSPDAAER